jgi:hypothetical protein
MQSTMHVYEVRPRKDNRGVDLISDVLPFGRLYSTPLLSRGEVTVPTQQAAAGRVRSDADTAPGARAL